MTTDEQSWITQEPDGRMPWQRWHRHRWSQWSDLPCTRVVSDVRHCEVCNKRQTRQP